MPTEEGIMHNKWRLEQSLSVNHTPFLTTNDYAGDPATIDGIPFTNNSGNVAYVDGHQAFKIFCDASGQPALCRTLPWTKSIDPLQRSAEKDSCRDPDNPTGAGYNTSNWF
jgi:prepilin-type processing-associated H-X9-DG protein